MVHLVLEAAEQAPLGCLQVNRRGSGPKRYHRRMMLALLIYCYANGVFGLRSPQYQPIQPPILDSLCLIFGTHEGANPRVRD